MQLTLLKITPQELPGHSMAMWISVVAAFLSCLLGLLFAYPLIDSIIRSALAIVVPGVFVYTILLIKKTPSRFNQAFCAMCGSAAVIYVIALPLMPSFLSVASGLATDSVSDSSSGNLIIFVVLLLDVWALVITAHIFRHTFDISLATGISLAVALMMITLLVMQVLGPMNRDGIGVDDSSRSALTQPI